MEQFNQLESALESVIAELLGKVKEWQKELQWKYSELAANPQINQVASWYVTFFYFNVKFIISFI